MDQKTRRHIAQTLLQAAEQLAPGAGQPPSDMTVSNLKQIQRDSEAILAILNENMEIMGWAEDKVSQAKVLINSVRNYIEGDFGAAQPTNEGNNGQR
jgi:hypothetical protein